MGGQMPETRLKGGILNKKGENRNHHFLLTSIQFIKELNPEKMSAPEG